MVLWSIEKVRRNKCIQLDERTTGRPAMGVARRLSDGRASCGCSRGCSPWYPSRSLPGTPTPSPGELTGRGRHDRPGGPLGTVAPRARIMAGRVAHRPSPVMFFEVLDQHLPVSAVDSLLTAEELARRIMRVAREIPFYLAWVATSPTASGGGGLRVVVAIV
ncbi:hypothetical protein BD413DRAFT_579338 [Trametes elegans]|nr:hypothetical protein BD413DRAFT_579338 [Trametes elegans]